MRGGFPGGGSMSNILKQAQKMQADMLKTQEELGNKILEASSGGGAVTVTATGKKELKSVKQVKVLPYHNYADQEYAMLGLN